MATVPSYRTWVAGEVLTAANLNSNVRDAGNFWLTNKPVCEARQATPQSIANSSWVSVTFDTNDYNNDSMHSTTTNTTRFTATTAGRYMFTAQCNFAANNTGARALKFAITRVAGVGLVSGAINKVGQIAVPGSSLDISLCTTMVVYMAATDYVEAQVWQSSGGALNLASGDGQPRFQCLWVHNA